MSMDEILTANERKFVTSPVDFRSFLFFAKSNADANASLVLFENARETAQKVAWLDENLVDTLLQTIDVTDLRGQMFNRETDQGVERTKFMSQKILMEEISRRRNAQYESIVFRSLRYDHVSMNALARKSPFYCPKSSPTLGSNINNAYEPRIDYNDLLISVSVFLGYTRELEYHEVRLGRLMKVTDRIEMTGEHTLEDLKNAFSCAADYAFTEDFSEKTPTIDDVAKTKYPSNLFFIHDTLFVDEKSRPDSYENIQEWASKRDNIGPMNIMSMKTKLGDLTARLGQPYVFIHQGICEHLIVFNDLSLRDESHRDVVFQRRLIERNFRRIACHLCKEASANWMVLEHESLFPTARGYLCSECYREFCFDVNGNKVDTFKAVPYCDRRAIGDSGKLMSEWRFETKK